MRTGERLDDANALYRADRARHLGAYRFADSLVSGARGSAGGGGLAARRSSAMEQVGDGDYRVEPVSPACVDLLALCDAPYSSRVSRTVIGAAAQGRRGQPATHRGPLWPAARAA